MIFSSNYISLFLTEEGNVWAIGHKPYCGVNDEDRIKYETNIKGLVKVNLINILTISCGFDYSLCCDYNGDVWGFGSNSYGQLGLGDKITRPTPEKNKSLKNIRKIFCGCYHSFCIDGDYDVYGFGYSVSNQLGISSIKGHQVSPLKIPITEEIKEIAAGHDHSLFLDFNGKVYVCGGNPYGQLGLGDINTKSSITLNENLEDIISISCSIYSSFALNSSKELIVFGYNSNGILTFKKSSANVTIPQKVTLPIESEIKSITCGTNELRILETNGDVWVYGKGEFSSRGFNLLHSADIEYISSGGDHIFMKSSDCTYGYGSNSDNKLGCASKYTTDATKLPEEINSLISIPYEYLKVKSARK